MTRYWPIATKDHFLVMAACCAPSAARARWRLSPQAAWRTRSTRHRWPSRPLPHHGELDV